MYNANYSVFLLRISFYIYIYIYIYACLVFHATEEDTTQHGCGSVIVAFISLWKLKFLAYLLNITQRFVMRIISYANIVYFIFI